MKIKQNLRYILIIIIMALLTSCATAPIADKMLPSLDYSRYVSTNKTLRVTEVTGGEETNPIMGSKIDGEGFQKAIISALTKTGMFKEVVLEDNGDYELHTDIVSQQLERALTMSVILFVHYELTDTKSDQNVWEESIISQYDAKFEEAFSGDVRARKAHEGAVRDNLSKLLLKLSEVLEKQNLN